VVYWLFVYFVLVIRSPLSLISTLPFVMSTALICHFDRREKSHWAINSIRRSLVAPLRRYDKGGGRSIGKTWRRFFFLSFRPNVSYRPLYGVIAIALHCHTLHRDDTGMAAVRGGRSIGKTWRRFFFLSFRPNVSYRPLYGVIAIALHCHMAALFLLVVPPQCVISTALWCHSDCLTLSYRQQGDISLSA
jgi:hypothetical protein